MDSKILRAAAREDDGGQHLPTHFGMLARGASAGRPRLPPLPPPARGFAPATPTPATGRRPPAPRRPRGGGTARPRKRNRSNDAAEDITVWRAIIRAFAACSVRVPRGM